MKIYAQIQELGIEFPMYIVKNIASHPFDNDCWEANFEDYIPTYFECIYDLLEAWSPYNTITVECGTVDENGNFCFNNNVAGARNAVYRSIVYVKGKISDSLIADDYISGGMLFIE